MKTRTLAALLAALAAFPAARVAASIAVNGAMTYTQDFDAALGVSIQQWADDSLIPGWYAQINNGTTTNGSVLPADGNTVLNGLLNCGTAGAPDRALGSKATGSTANIAYAVSFQNTSTNPIQWSGLRYRGECWLTNSTTGGTAPEVFTTFYQKSPAAITNILSGTNSSTAAAGAGFTALGAGGNWTSPVVLPVAAARDGNAAGNFADVSYTPPTAVVLQPGEFLTIKWTDSNLANADGFQAIDNVEVDFMQLEGSVVAAASQRTRDLAGTPANLADDTFGFTAQINGSGSVTTWTAAGVNPPVTNASSGNYGTSVVWTGFPVTGPKNVTITDAGNASFSTALSVPPLAVIGSNDVVLTGTPILHEDVFFTGWTINESTRTLTQTNLTGQTDRVINSEVIDLTTTGFVQFKADLHAKAGTSSGFEAPDRFALQLIVNGGTPISVLGTADTNNDGYLTGVDTGGGIGTELPGHDAPDNTDKPLSFSYIVPDTADTLQIRIIGNSNSPSETYEVSGIKLLPPPPTILATVGGTIFDNRGTVSPADDQFSAAVTVTPVNLAGSPGWNSNSVPVSGLYSPPAIVFGPYAATAGSQPVTIVDQGNQFASTQVTIPAPAAASITVSAPTNIQRIANGPGPADDTLTFQVSVNGVNTGPFWNATGGAQPATGFYGPGPFMLTISAPLPATGPAVLTFTDASYPAATQTLNVPVPSVYIIGQTNFGALQPLYSQPVSPPDTAWVNNATARTLTMTDGDVPGPGNKTVTSEVVNLAAINGPVRFDMNLHVHDSTTGFEAADNFNAWLIYDGAAAAPVSLIGPYDTDASGTLTGGELAAPLPANGVQDHDYPMIAIIPDNVVTVQLVIAGLDDSANETMTISNILFAPAPATNDNDGDGISNAAEDLMGTDPDDPNSVLRLSQNAGNPLQLDFPTVAGRYYRVYTSNDAAPGTHLQSWVDAGGPTITAADGNPAHFTITVAPGVGRRWYRLHVMRTDGPWP